MHSKEGHGVDSNVMDELRNKTRVSTNSILHKMQETYALTDSYGIFGGCPLRGKLSGHSSNLGS